MEMVAGRFGVELTQVRPSRAEFLDALPGVIASQDEPFGSASVAAQWFVFRAAREGGIKVMLDGQGADEVFGGYHHYLTLIGESLLLDGSAREFARLMRGAGVGTGTRPYPPVLGASALMPRPLRLAAANTLAEVRTRRDPTGVLSARHVAPAMHSLMPPRDLSSRLDPDGMLRAEVESQSLPGLLRYEDRNSMAHSIEARVPYLDHRLVEQAFRLPALLRIRGGMPKQVLREALADVIPPAILQRRDKVGFRASPSATWELARRDRDSLIAAGSEPEARWFQPREVARLIDGGDQSTDVEFALWRVINTKLWARGLWGESDASST
jgi:asparagine synthase (glutamine-hydrolysing)